MHMFGPQIEGGPDLHQELRRALAAPGSLFVGTKGPTGLVPNGGQQFGGWPGGTPARMQGVSHTCLLQVMRCTSGHCRAHHPPPSLPPPSRTLVALPVSAGLLHQYEAADAPAAAADQSCQSRALRSQHTQNERYACGACSGARPCGRLACPCAGLSPLSQPPPSPPHTMTSLE